MSRAVSKSETYLQLFPRQGRTKSSGHFRIQSSQIHQRGFQHILVKLAIRILHYVRDLIYRHLFILRPHFSGSLCQIEHGITRGRIYPSETVSENGSGSIPLDIGSTTSPIHILKLLKILNKGIGNLVLVLRNIEGVYPIHILTQIQTEIDVEFPSLILQRGYIGTDTFTPVRNRSSHISQQIAGGIPVIVKRTTDTVIPKSEIQTDIPVFFMLPLDIRVRESHAFCNKQTVIFLSTQVNQRHRVRTTVNISRVPVRNTYRQIGNKVYVLQEILPHSIPTETG